MWTRIFRQVSANNDLTTAENARLFAMVYLSAADGAIHAWDEKALALLASNHGDPRGRERRELGDGGRPELDVGDRQSAVSRSRVGAVGRLARR